MKRIVMLLVCLGCWRPAAAQDAAAVLACMKANVPPALRVQDLRLRSIDAQGGERVMEGRLTASSERGKDGRPLVRATLSVRSPQTVAGAAYLVRESDGEVDPGVYIYLPAVRRVRRVTGSFADASLLGSDFSYNDFKRLQNVFGDARVTLEGSALIQQRSTQILRLVPSTGDGEAQRVRLWVDSKTCVPLQAQFDQGGPVLKEMTVPVAALQRIGGRWSASQLLMRNLAEHTQSELSLSEVRTSAALPASLFDPQTFYLGAGR